MMRLLGIFSFLVVLLRAAILCFQSIAVGGVLFLTIVTRKPELRPEEFVRPAWKLIRGSAVGLAVSQLFFVIANSFVLTYSAEIPLREMLGANFVLAAGLAIASALTLALWPTAWRSRASALAMIPAGLMLAGSVITSHAASRMEDRVLLVSLTAVHYIAVASWVGGLLYLLLAMKRIRDDDVKVRVGRNFSRVAQGSVAALFLAGLILSVVYVGSWQALYGTAYGLMILAKMALFGCMLLLGAANYSVVHGVRKSATGGRSLLRFGEAEIGIGLTAILTATSLTSQPPGVDLTQDRVTLQEIARRFAPRAPRLSSPELKELSEPTEQVYKNAAATGRSLPPAFVPGQSETHPNTPADIAWSEYNHNWAGLIVFLMGILALLSRSRQFPWAKMWPLIFLGLAVFLFLRADPENWPLGPNGFWESFGEAEVLQHRLAVLMVVVFAIFQWRVETNRMRSQAAALVFPAVCALGGIVLLTHTHALGNIKEELFAEWSHTPLAIFAVVAGWSRWLELRLPQEDENRKYAAWIWPVCFILIGLILLNYHES